VEGCVYIFVEGITSNSPKPTRMRYFPLISFFLLVLVSACQDDDTMVQPENEATFPVLNIFECSGWETMELSTSFSRRAEDTIYQTLHVNYPTICAAGTRRSEISSRIIGDGSVVSFSELTGLAFKDKAIYNAGEVSLIGRGPETLFIGERDQDYTAMASFQDELYTLSGRGGTRSLNTVFSINQPFVPVALYDTTMLGLPQKLFSKHDGETLWIWTVDSTVIELNGNQEVENIYGTSELNLDFMGATDERRRSLYFDDRAVFLGTVEDSKLTLYQVSGGFIGTNVINLDTISGSQTISAVAFHNDRLYVNLLQGDESNLYVFPIAGDGSQNGDIEKFATKLPGTEVLRDLEIVDDRIFLLLNNSIKYGNGCVL
jgi:hypothetical protein